MSDNYIQSGTNQGTTTAAVTLTGVTAGSTIVVVAGVGNTITPTLHSVSDGTSYTPQGSPVTDATNTVWLQSYTLENVSSGSHAIVFTSDTSNQCFIFAAEIGSSGTGVVCGVNGAEQTNPGTGTSALSSGSVTVTGAATLCGFSVDTSSTAGTDEPVAGTGFTTRNNGVGGSSIGAWRFETMAVAANAAATATAVTGVHEFSTIGVAVLNSSGGGGGGGTCLQESEWHVLEPQTSPLTVSTW